MRHHRGSAVNAVEIEEAVSALVEAPFDAAEFPYRFLAAFGNKPTTIKRLRSGSTNKSDVAGGVLQRNNIHIAVCDPGLVEETMPALQESPATASQKAKYILATDGRTIEAENLVEGETLACAYEDLPNHFGFFLPLAGITTVRQIRENAFDIRATGRLFKLYIELRKQNPDWDTAERREDLNHFFARLIFCFFAEDTNIFHGEGLFTNTIAQMSAPDSSNTHEVIAEIFRAMNTKTSERAAGDLRPWANTFPYVNGGLFSGSLDVPRFSKIARSYLLHIGGLDWKQINPDIFGSMIQAVADDEERGELGMHYTSVPNILKVLNPLFLDDLRAQLEEAGDNARKLLNLRNRIARIRVFDPACGSGNFLVIAYKEMRAIEAEINRRREEGERTSDIPLTNFRGIEIRHFASEIARLALIIAEYQCDVLYRGPKLALAEFLPLEAANWITQGNALRLDWVRICPPTGSGVRVASDDLFETPLRQVEIDFENEGGETFICGNPPYLGNKLQSKDQKDDLRHVFDGRVKGWKSLDYVAAWVLKAVDYGSTTPTSVAFVTTNSICQGQQVPILWPLILQSGYHISFAHTSFKWTNLATNKAGVIVVVVGIAMAHSQEKRLMSSNSDGTVAMRICDNINPYLVDGPNVVVDARKQPPADRSLMFFGNMPRDGGNLLVSKKLQSRLVSDDPVASRFLRRYIGSEDFIQGHIRYCLWIDNGSVDDARTSPFIAKRLNAVRQMRLESKAASTQQFSAEPHRFVQIQGHAEKYSIIIPRVSSERRPYLPVGLLSADTIVADSAFALYDAPLWQFAILASRIHLVWVAAVCGKLKTDYRYSNTLGWNTFPLPVLTEGNTEALTGCAKSILLARERCFPSTIAEIYNAESMPSDLVEAHRAADEILERIYIGRRFKNDTERLEVLFRLYADRQSVVASGEADASGACHA
jgi:hypothetical protein